MKASRLPFWKEFLTLFGKKRTPAHYAMRRFFRGESYIQVHPRSGAPAGFESSQRHTTSLRLPRAYRTRCTPAGRIDVVLRGEARLKSTRFSLSGRARRKHSSVSARTTRSGALYGVSVTYMFSVERMANQQTRSRTHLYPRAQPLQPRMALLLCAAPPVPDQCYCSSITHSSHSM